MLQTPLNSWMVFFKLHVEPPSTCSSAIKQLAALNKLFRLENEKVWASLTAGEQRTAFQMASHDNYINNNDNNNNNNNNNYNDIKNNYYDDGSNSDDDGDDNHYKEKKFDIMIIFYEITPFFAFMCLSTPCWQSYTL